VIISHEHRFIFLKTKRRPARVELALRQLCGPDDIITPITAEDEALRNGLGPQKLATALLVQVAATVVEGRWQKLRKAS
jgi:hypothetical protein